MKDSIGKWITIIVLCVLIGLGGFISFQNMWKKTIEETKVQTVRVEVVPPPAPFTDPKKFTEDFTKSMIRDVAPVPTEVLQITYTYTMDNTGRRKPICPGNSFGYPENSGRGLWIKCANPVTKEPMGVFIENLPVLVYPVEMP